MYLEINYNHDKNIKQSFRVSKATFSTIYLVPVKHNMFTTCACCCLAFLDYFCQSICLKTFPRIRAGACAFQIGEAEVGIQFDSTRQEHVV